MMMNNETTAVPPVCLWCLSSITGDVLWLDGKPYHFWCSPKQTPLTEQRIREIVREEIAAPKSAAPLLIWYMRDNHTFRSLPVAVQPALAILEEEFSAGNTYGMLCSQHPKLLDSVHAGSSKEWDKFASEAQLWLERAVAIAAQKGT
jgi:hypothetical protein